MITEDQKQTLFRHYPILSKLDQTQLKQSLSSAQAVNLKKGTLIFDELQPCNAFPFILSGRIRIFKQSVNGRELSLYNVESGDVCIVSAGCLLGNEAYQASGLIKEDTILVMLTAGDFNELLSSPLFREFIFSLISKRILGLMQLVEEVAFHNLDRRLASLLIRQGRHLRTSHQELADELGTVREMITRVLNHFSDAGWLELGRERIEILDESALRQIIKH